MNESDLLNEVLETDNRDLRLLAANGLLPLVPEELVRLQILLAGDADEEVATYAEDSLAETNPTIVARFVRESADEGGLEFLAHHASHPVVLEAILRRRDVSRPLLAEMAPKLDPALQEVLVLRQDAISEHSAILEALESNPDLSSHVRRRLTEYRELMAPGSTSGKSGKEGEADIESPVGVLEIEPVTAVPIEDEPAVPEVRPEGEEGWWDDLGEPMVAEKIQTDEALSRAEKILEEKADEDITTQDRGLSEAQIRSMPIPDRLKLTRGASKGLRGILIKDPNPLVAMSVLENNTLSDQEVESVARNRSVIDDVLKAIAKNRQWIRKYPVMQALATNPKTPVHVSIKLITQLTPRDLKGLMKDRNIPEPVRSQARRLHQARTG